MRNELLLSEDYPTETSISLEQMLASLISTEIRTKQKESRFESKPFANLLIYGIVPPLIESSALPSISLNFPQPS